MAFVLAISFFSGKGAEIINKVTGNCVCLHSIADIGSPRFPFLFPSLYHSFVDPLGWVKRKQDLSVVLQQAGAAGHSAHSSLLYEENCF